jgi:hypothetical protein
MRDKPSEIKFEDLSRESQEKFKKLLARAITRVVPIEWQSFYDSITDPIERKLWDDFDKIIDIHGEDALCSVYVVKPGKHKGPVRFAELKDGHQVVVLRYTCVTAEVPEPLAFISVVQMEHGRPAVKEKLVFYNSEAGWKSRTEAPNRPKGKENGAKRAKKERSGTLVNPPQD